MRVAARGDLAGLQALVCHGASLHEYDEDFKTALDRCANAECRAFLLAQAAALC